jgi:hypothetical protein
VGENDSRNKLRNTVSYTQIWRHPVWQKFTYVSEHPATSIIKVHPCNDYWNTPLRTGGTNITLVASLMSKAKFDARAIDEGKIRRPRYRPCLVSALLKNNKLPVTWSNVSKFTPENVRYLLVCVTSVSFTPHPNIRLLIRSKAKDVISRKHNTRATKTTGKHNKNSSTWRSSVSRDTLQRWRNNLHGYAML